MNATLHNESIDALIGNVNAEEEAREVAQYIVQQISRIVQCWNTSFELLRKTEDALDESQATQDAYHECLDQAVRVAHTTRKTAALAEFMRPLFQEYPEQWNMIEESYKTTIFPVLHQIEENNFA